MRSTRGRHVLQVHCESSYSLPPAFRSIRGDSFSWFLRCRWASVMAKCQNVYTLRLYQRLIHQVKKKILGGPNKRPSSASLFTYGLLQACELENSAQAWGSERWNS